MSDSEVNFRYYVDMGRRSDFLALKTSINRCTKFRGERTKSTFILRKGCAVVLQVQGEF